MRCLTLPRLGWQTSLCRLPGRLPSSLIARRWAHTHPDPSAKPQHIKPSQSSKFPEIDAKWQQRWKEIEVDAGKAAGKTEGKAYILPMFPYPSGTLHLGHLRVYTISDVLARFNQMQGREVIHPIGWDAFGLPAENAALERGINPETWTLKNIETMKEQMKAMGGRWDWDREIMTCDPEFYKHTQRIFLMLYERGLAYQAESLVNYDPVDRTVLANEQVDANGCSWRSGAKVEKVMLTQWFLKIKEFQEPLLNDLEVLAQEGNWPERVLAMQKNWIGRSQGAKLWFDVEGENGKKYEPVDVFTTRADTLFGVQYLALSMTHPIVQEAAKEDAALQAFLDQAEHLPADSKAGYLLKGITALNPISKLGGEEQKVPIYVAPYVLSDYGSGAVMGVPGHDNRDHAFWRTNAGDAPIRQVVNPSVGQPSRILMAGEESDNPFSEKGFVASDIPKFGGLPSAQAVNEIITQLSQFGARAELTSTWRLRDWLISRQRYWGTPIPIIHCGSCGPVPVPASQLPVELPKMSASAFQKKLGNPLAEHPTWKHTNCPKCGSVAERETDTMDTFMDSSWYFFRFLSPKLEDAPVAAKEADTHMPVDIYIGGVEHAILHLLYARFISKFFASTSLWPSGHRVAGEPFKKLITQGMVHGKTYSDPSTGRFLRPEEVDLSNPNKPVMVSTGEAPQISFEKMSKSKYNGVDPGATISKYGADVTRAHMLFQAPVADVLEWDETKITGVSRWLGRVLKLSTGSVFLPPDELKAFSPPTNDLDAPITEILAQLIKTGVLSPKQGDRHIERSQDDLLATLKFEEAQLWSRLQQTIDSVRASYAETISLNTIVSDLMTLTNVISDAAYTSPTMPYLRWYATVHLLRMLAPIAPATAEECWETLMSATARSVGESHILAPYSTARSSASATRTSLSIFNFGFPRAETGVVKLLNQTTKCVFSVDGKRKFETEIPKVPAQISALANKSEKAAKMRDFVVGQLLQREEGKKWMEKGTGTVWGIAGTEEAEDACGGWVPKGWSVIVAKGGGIVNVVGPKKKGGKKQ